MFYPSDDNPSMSTQHCRESFGAMIESMFTSELAPIVEFWSAAKNDRDPEVASILLANIWRRMIMPRLLESKIYIQKAEISEFFRHFFNGENQIDMEIWYQALAGPYEVSDLEGLQHLREDLEMAEDWDLADLQGQAQLRRQDMYNKIVRLAFLATSRLGDTRFLQDRIKTSFAKDLSRLLQRFLPESKIVTDGEELKKVILEQIPAVRKNQQLLKIVDSYTEIMILPPTEEVEEAPIDLIEEIIDAEVSEVKVPEIAIDETSHLGKVVEEEIQITSKGFLLAMNKISFDETTEDDYRKDLLSLFYKILEQVADKGGITSLGGLRVLVFDIKKKLETKLGNKEKTKWSKNDVKCNIMIVALGLFEAKISELMPSSFSPVDTCGFYTGKG